MSRNESDQGRRRFLKLGFMGTAALPVVVLMGRSRTAGAQSEMPKLSEDDPAAKALGYVTDASKTDNAAHQDGAHCANCQLFQGDESTEWAGCGAFPGKRVHAQGWCSAWVEKG